MAVYDREHLLYSNIKLIGRPGNSGGSWDHSTGTDICLFFNSVAIRTIYDLLSRSSAG